jgi:hypothetical protein
MDDPHHVPYATPKDFDRALTDRIARAARNLPYSVPQPRRQFAYGKLFTRVFLHGPAQWSSRMPLVSSLGYPAGPVTVWMSTSTSQAHLSKPSTTFGKLPMPISETSSISR